MYPKKYAILIKNNETIMNKFLLLMVVLFFIILFSGCTTYYTKLYAVSPPPADINTWSGDKLKCSPIGWEISAGIIGVLGSHHMSEVKKDSFYLEIGIKAKDTTLHSSDSIYIDSAYISFKKGDIILRPPIRGKYGRNGQYSVYYQEIYIPSLEPAIEVGFILRILAIDGKESTVKCQAILNRYESKRIAPLFD
jgi:hypothetical protein